MKKRAPTPAKETKLLPKPDPGPRPLSETQRAFVASQRSQGATATPARVLSQPVFSEGNGESARRPGQLTQERAKAKRAQRINSLREQRRENRRRINWPPILLKLSLAVFVAECALALLYSPRLYVRNIVVEGEQTVPEAILLKRLGIKDGQNILRLPTDKLKTQVEVEPTIDAVTIHRELPGTVRVKVIERTPFASVQLANFGKSYTIDRKLVPFRESELPEKGLPVILVKEAGIKVPTLGKPMVITELPGALQCVDWKTANQTRFPIENIVIDATGKLCLNRAGGVLVRLGAGMDLTDKLNTLSLLLDRVTTLQGSGETAVTSVNLYAYDAPALLYKTDKPTTTDATQPTASDTP